MSPMKQIVYVGRSSLSQSAQTTGEDDGAGWGTFRPCPRTVRSSSWEEEKDRAGIDGRTDGLGLPSVAVTEPAARARSQSELAGWPDGPTGRRESLERPCRTNARYELARLTTEIVE